MTGLEAAVTVVAVVCFFGFFSLFAVLFYLRSKAK